jgi:hypothetical protein
MMTRYRQITTRVRQLKQSALLRRVLQRLAEGMR